MRPTRQLSCLLLREGEKLCNIFFFVLSVQSGDVQCVSYVLFRFSEKERMARQKRSRRNEPPQAMSLILCARFFLSKPQTLRWFAVWSPGDSDFPSDIVRIKASYSINLPGLFCVRGNDANLRLKSVYISSIIRYAIEKE